MSAFCSLAVNAHFTGKLSGRFPRVWERGKIVASFCLSDAIDLVQIAGDFVGPTGWREIAEEVRGHAARVGALDEKP